MFQRRKSLLKYDRNFGRRTASLLICCGVLLLLLSLILTLSGFYTEAASLSSVQIWLGQELISTTPGPGGGDLFDQLQLTVEYGDAVIYKGSMSDFGEAREVTNLSGMVAPGQVVLINLTVCLPGPETGNEYQGSSVSTRFSVLARCTRPDGRPTVCNINLKPTESFFNLGNLNPGDCYTRNLEIIITETVTPPFVPPEIIYSPVPPPVEPALPVKPKPPVVPPAEEEEDKLVLPPKEAEKPLPYPEVPVDELRPKPILPKTGGYSLAAGIFGTIMIIAGVIIKRRDRD